LDLNLQRESKVKNDSPRFAAGLNMRQAQEVASKNSNGDVWYCKNTFSRFVDKIRV
jgi:hypothetical protein